MPKEEMSEKEQPIKISQEVKVLVEAIKYVARELHVDHETAAKMLDNFNLAL